MGIAAIFEGNFIPPTHEGFWGEEVWKCWRTTVGQRMLDNNEISDQVSETPEKRDSKSTLHHMVKCLVSYLTEIKFKIWRVTFLLLRSFGMNFRFSGIYRGNHRRDAPDMRYSFPSTHYKDDFNIAIISVSLTDISTNCLSWNQRLARWHGNALIIYHYQQALYQGIVSVPDHCLSFYL